MGYNSYIGTISIFALDFAPYDYFYCDGLELMCQDESTLCSVLNFNYGEKFGWTIFKLPDLRVRFPMGCFAEKREDTKIQDSIGQQGGSQYLFIDRTYLPAHTHPFYVSLKNATEFTPENNLLAQPTSKFTTYIYTEHKKKETTHLASKSLTYTGQSALKNRTIEYMPPYLSLNFSILKDGIYPPRPRSISQNTNEQSHIDDTSDFFLGEIFMFGNDYPPKGWADCDGSILNIQNNEALYSLLGTRYGGDNVNFFALPDLRGRIPIGQSEDYPIGSTGGATTITLEKSHLVEHSHYVQVSKQEGTSQLGENMVLAQGKSRKTPKIYTGLTDTPVVPMNSKSIGSTGDGEPINAMPPYTVVRFCICIDGAYPPRY